MQLFKGERVIQMKKPKISVLQTNNNLTGLGLALSRMGFVGEFFTNTKSLRVTIQESVPDLVLVDAKLANKGSKIEGVEKNLLEASNLCPVLLAEKEEGSFLLYDHRRKKVLHLFDLHNYFHENLDSYSRKNIRLEVKLPSLLTQGHSSQLTQITSLSSRGVFVRTGYSTPVLDQKIEITIPLLGHYAELNVLGRVAYSVSPSQGNNYIQGVGVCFERPEDSLMEVIEDYLSSSLAKEPSLNFVPGEKNKSWHSEPLVKKRPSLRAMHVVS